MDARGVEGGVVLYQNGIYYYYYNGWEGCRCFVYVIIVAIINFWISYFFETTTKIGMTMKATRLLSYNITISEMNNNMTNTTNYQIGSWNWYSCHFCQGQGGRRRRRIRISKEVKI